MPLVAISMWGQLQGYAQAVSFGINVAVMLVHGVRQLRLMELLHMEQDMPTSLARLTYSGLM